MTSAKHALFARSVRNVALAARASFEQVETEDDSVVFSVTFEVGEGGRQASARLGLRHEPGGTVGVDVFADFSYDDHEASVECAKIVAGVSDWVAFERLRFDDFTGLRASLARHRPIDPESPESQVWIRYQLDGYEAYVSVFSIESELEEWVIFRSTLCDQDDWSAEQALIESVELPYAMIGLHEGEFVLFYSLPLEALSLGRALDIADTMGGTALGLMAQIFDETEDGEESDEDEA
jgi:hypothetical protein